MRRSHSAAVCAGLGLVAALQMYALPSRPGEALSFAEALLWRGTPWLLWMLWMPLIVALRRQFPARRQLVAALPLHAALYGVVVATAALADIVCGRLAHQPPYPDYPLTELLGPVTIKLALSNLAVYGAVVIADAAIEYQRRYRDADARLAQAQLAALKMQLHPHFLFNTLNSIAVLVRKGDGPRALALLDGLSELLRYSLGTMKVEHVAVRDEVAFVARYLAIQQLRFSDRLTVEVEVEPAAARARIPSLVTQPLVENALKHGVARRAGASTVAVRAGLADDRLRVEVTDHGDGTGASEAPALPGTGLGLPHVRERLAQLYPGRHQLRLQPHPAGGTTAILEIPYEPIETA